ncbi:hypothetical protein F4561_002169 [Lipingzhangella halophila]|uniref:Uncharacterized protein n=1 Tax=Lipingzhangella halophila TaxID=1783352 RepID=A0A7W7W320_9ACTN|nr:hypothetical protein [Lipingzhangella halophila]MBB4931349.1 hypothetical protein [Lipingzhangella halophila]
MRIAVLIIYTIAAALTAYGYADGPWFVIHAVGAVSALCAAGLAITHAGLIGQAERELYGPGERDQAQIDIDDNDW